MKMTLIRLIYKHPFSFRLFVSLTLIKTIFGLFLRDPTLLTRPTLIISSIIHISFNYFFT